MVDEKILQWIWDQLHFQFLELITTDGNPVQIIDKGVLNKGQGPDFLDAKICINGVILIGAIELHIDSQNWYYHRHHVDKRYNSVILHVVLRTRNNPVRREDNTIIPEIVLEEFIQPDFALKYSLLQLQKKKVPCAPFLAKDDFSIPKKWIRKLALNRLHRKALQYYHRLEACKFDWTQVLWEALAEALAGPINKNSFGRLAKHIPIKLLKKYRNNRLYMEALLYGGGGLLEGLPEANSYIGELGATWSFLAHKHGLRLRQVSLSFLNVRPPSFPTIRISQLASLIQQWGNLGELLEMKHHKLFLAQEIGTSEYWNSHYTFLSKSKERKKVLGKALKRSILINMVAPLSLLYGYLYTAVSFEDQVVSLLEGLPAERNYISKEYQKLGFEIKTALDSQGVLELQQHYCKPKKCLSCAIGKKILTNNGKTVKLASDWKWNDPPVGY